MSDTHRATPRYAVEHVNAGCISEEIVKYLVIDTNTDGIYSRHYSRESALAAAYILNEQATKEEQP